jgi:hypothetical protein
MFLLWRHPAQANVQWKEELSKDRDSMRQVLEGVCVCCCRGVLNLVGIDCSIISGVRTQYRNESLLTLCPHYRKSM